MIEDMVQMSKAYESEGKERINSPITNADTAAPAQAARPQLNEYFLDHSEIHRDVLQRKICHYLGPEAYSRPATYNVLTAL